MAPVKVLQLVDDSDCSEYAFKWAQDHVLLPRKGDDYELTILSVSTPHPAPDYLGHSTVREAEFERASQEAYNIARRYYDKGVAAGLKKEHIHLKVVSEIDGIGRAVKDFTEKEDASFDLCVCGSRGMGSFKRFMTGIADSLGLGLGSVSDYCVHHLPFPVLVIKPPHDPQHAKSAAEAHMQKGANTSKATTMAELRGEDSSPAEAAAQQGSAPLKVATIPGVGSVAPATPTAAAASQQG